MTTHKGSCLCKKVSFEIDGEFSGFFFCHCTRCQKETGTTHASNLFSKDGTLTWSTGENHVKSYTLEGSKFATSFCNHCGGKLPTVMEGGRLMIPAGTLDTDVAITPNAHIFWGSRASWEDKVAATEKHDSYPGK